MTHSVLRKPHLLLPGEGESFQMLSHTFTTKVAGEDTNGQWAMYEVTDTVNNGAPLHTHPWDETFYLLEGELEVQIGSQKIRATTGSVVHFPPDVVHAFKVCSPTVRFLVMVAPAAAEAFYQEIGEGITALPPDPAVFQEICVKHQVRLLP